MSRTGKDHSKSLMNSFRNFNLSRDKICGYIMAFRVEKGFPALSPNMAGEPSDNWDAGQVCDDPRAYTFVVSSFVEIDYQCLDEMSHILAGINLDKPHGKLLHLIDAASLLPS